MPKQFLPTAHPIGLFPWSEALLPSLGYRSNFQPLHEPQTVPEILVPYPGERLIARPVNAAEQRIENHVFDLPLRLLGPSHPGSPARQLPLVPYAASAVRGEAALRFALVRRSTMYYHPSMSLAEIEDAVMALPAEEQQALLVLLSSRLRKDAPVTTRRPLKAASYPPLQGLPPDLSVRVKETMRELVAKRHAEDR